MNCKGYVRKRSYLNLRYYSDICLEGLRKTMKKLSKSSRCPSQDLNAGSPEYESGLLATFLCYIEFHVNS
jgi:hypothetical protein